LFIVATALFIAAVVLGAVNGTALGRWIAVVVAFACYLAVFVADWQDESVLRARIDGIRALSAERARIIGDFVHRSRMEKP
jgi:hypothetical protein